MNIVYLIGNGLDVKYNLKTQYQEFYDNAYKPQDSDPQYIQSLKKAIKNDEYNWADLEKKFGEYSQDKDVDSEETYQKMFENIRGKLIEYLKNQELKRELSDSERNVFIETFRNPAQYLIEREKRKVNEFIQNKNTNTSLDHIYFVTFNYTRTLEILLRFNGGGIDIDAPGRRRLYINQINHIHGYANDRFVLGVDNEDQILNTKFRSDVLLNLMVKPRNNNIAGHMVDDDCENLINNANIICTYGMSIGDTDKTWWRLIGKNLVRDIKLIIFWWDNDDISTLFNEKLFNKREEVKNKFLNETDLDEKLKEAVRNKIYVVIKEEGIFNIPKPEATLVKL